MIHIPSGFYVFTGAILILTGGFQLVERVRREGARSLIGFGPLFGVFSVVAGLMVVYFGLFIHR